MTMHNWHDDDDFNWFFRTWMKMAGVVVAMNIVFWGALLVIAGLILNHYGVI